MITVRPVPADEPGEVYLQRTDNGLYLVGLYAHQHLGTDRQVSVPVWNRRACQTPLSFTSTNLAAECADLLLTDLTIEPVTI